MLSVWFKDAVLDLLDSTYMNGIYYVWIKNKCDKKEGIIYIFFYFTWLSINTVEPTSGIKVKRYIWIFFVHSLPTTNIINRDNNVYFITWAF